MAGMLELEQVAGSHESNPTNLLSCTRGPPPSRRQGAAAPVTQRWMSSRKGILSAYIEWNKL
jgi:hypothetical protein